MSSYLDRIEISKFPEAKIIIFPDDFDDDELVYSILGPLINAEDQQESYFHGACRGELIFISSLAPTGWSVSVRFGGVNKKWVEIKLVPSNDAGIDPYPISRPQYERFVVSTLETLISNLMDDGTISAQEIVGLKFRVF